MLAIHPEYVVDENQQRKAVLLPLSDWECVVEELEELSEIRAYDDAKGRVQDSVPFEQAVREIKAGYDV